MQIIRTLLSICLFTLGNTAIQSNNDHVLSTSSNTQQKIFIQGPQNNYLLNSSTLFLPTDYLIMHNQVSDARTVIINDGMVGGQNSLVPEGVKSHAFRDSNDGDYFYQMWHLAHIDDKHSKTNVITIIVSLGGIEISPSGDIEDARRILDSSTDPKVYVQVYRAWTVSNTLPLTQSNIDGWWHSITHVFHTVMHIYNEIKPWIGVARTVLPILISMSDSQPGLGLKSITYSPEPQVITDSSTDSSSTSSTSNNSVFTYAVTSGEMAAIVICVFLAGGITVFIIPKIFTKMFTKKSQSSDIYRISDIESPSNKLTPFV